VRLAVRPGLNSSDPGVQEITQLCGYLPLAIGMVASQLYHHPAWNVAGRAAELAAATDRLAEHALALTAREDSDDERALATGRMLDYYQHVSGIAGVLCLDYQSSAPSAVTRQSRSPGALLSTHHTPCNRSGC
jgi:hypothetical protein